MLMMLMPWLTRIGYGLQWRDMLVMMWGGLRGAVGLCLSLEVYYSEPFCKLANDKVGTKVRSAQV
jgi:NhaP-type Na+/H+ or K+/H+ antiporter